jgi:hypothetical protein
LDAARVSTQRAANQRLLARLDSPVFFKLLCELVRQLMRDAR